VNLLSKISAPDQGAFFLLKMMAILQVRILLIFHIILVRNVRMMIKFW